MIIADLNIICVAQDKMCCPKDTGNIVFETHNRLCPNDPVYPTDNFDYAHGIVGWWYTFWPSDKYFLESPFFELSSNADPHGIRLSSIWEEEVFELLSYYINLSPKRKIGVLVRVQDKSNNIVHDCVSLDVIKEKMLNGQINFNELYLISK